MSNEEEKTWRQGKELDDAWLEYADHMWPEGQRVARMRALWRGEATDTLSDTERKEIDAERLERGLKSELLDAISEGYFQAFGRDITDGLDKPIIPLPPGLFDVRIDGFGINWERSTMTAYGRTIIEVRVLPDLNRLGSALIDVDVPKAAKGGRPRKRDALEQACRIAMRDVPGFCDLQTKQALPIVENILKTTLKTSEGFAGGVNEETLRRAKKVVCEGSLHS